MIAGFGNEASKEFQNFDFDTHSTSSFDIANKLWDIIGEGVSEE